MAHPTIVGIIPGRLDSTRLPGKALRKVKGVPLIGYVFARAKRILNLETLVLATSERSTDDPLAEYARSQGVAVYRGDLSDVSLRFLNCAAEFGGDYFVRLNGDCPFLDPVLIGEGIDHCLDSDVDFVTNLVNRTFPYGIAVEIVKVTTFVRAYNDMVLPEDREHITKYLYDHLHEFKVVPMESGLPDLAKARLVIDTEEDFRRFMIIVERLGDQLTQSRYTDIARLYLEIPTSMVHHDRGSHDEHVV